MLFNSRLCIFFIFIFLHFILFSNSLREKNVLERKSVITFFLHSLFYSSIVLSKISVVNMIEFLSSKHEKLMDENAMHYVPLKMFLLYYFISWNFKLVWDCWKIFSLSIVFLFKIKSFRISLCEKLKISHYFHSCLRKLYFTWSNDHVNTSL